MHVKIANLITILILSVFHNLLLAQEVDLSIDKTVDKNHVLLGEVVKFNVLLKNEGPNDASNIKVKDKLPSGYVLVEALASSGTYDNATGVWLLESLAKGASANLKIKATVVGGDLMNKAEVIECQQKDSDSKPNNGIDTDKDGQIVDDNGDEDDGDGQNVSIIEIENSLEDIKLVLEHKKDKQISYFDYDTMAMKLEYHSKGKNPDPIYFDNEGYVYSGQKGQYYKVPFKQIKNMGKTFGNMVPDFEYNLSYPDKPIIFNGKELHLYPNKFPIIEWAFIYKPEIFEGASNISKEIVSCRGEMNCQKFTAQNGKQAGSFILFDSRGRLAEIFTPKTGNAVYTYQPCSITLPSAQTFNLGLGN